MPSKYTITSISMSQISLLVPALPLRGCEAGPPSLPLHGCEAAALSLRDGETPLQTGPNVLYNHWIPITRTDESGNVETLPEGTESGLAEFP